VVEAVVEAVCDIVANLANYIEIESSIVADPVQSTSKTDSGGEGTDGTRTLQKFIVEASELPSE